MSFNFSWPTFSRQFHADAAKMLDAALNRGPKPKVIADDIKVEEINMGTKPPELEILEIGELSSERLRGIFRLTYAGDAHLLLSTKVQANPLTRPDPLRNATGISSPAASPFEDVSSAFPSSSTSRGILFAARPLVVPMQLRLSSVRLKAIVVLVVSKQKGITLVFKNDPLESVDVNSTFDSVAVIQKYLQQEIEGQLREMFREDLPGIIHRLSQTWLSGRNKKQSTDATAKAASSSASMVKSPTLRQADLAEAQPTPQTVRQARSSASVPVSASKGKSPARRRKKSNADKSTLAATPSSSPPMPQRGSTNSTPRAIPTARMGPLTSNDNTIKASRFSPSTSPASKKLSSSFPRGTTSTDAFFAASSSSPGGVSSEVENYDPTYGLRPNDVRIAANGTNFQGLARLASRTIRGFGDLPDLPTEEGERRKDRESQKPSDKAQAGDRSAASLMEGQPFGDDEVFGIEADMLDDAYQHDSDDVPDYPNPQRSSEDLDDTSDDDSEADETDDQELSEGGSLDHARRIDHDFGHSGSPQGLRIENAMGASSNLSGKQKPFNSSKESAERRSHLSSAASASPIEAQEVEYEVIPAVGGGMATRPRVYHIASRVQAPDVEEEDDLSGVAQYATTSIAASSTARGPASSRTAATVRPRHSMQNSYEEPLRDDHLESPDDMHGYQTDESPSAAGHESLDTLDPEEMDPSSIAYRTQLYRQQYGHTYRPGYEREPSVTSAEASSRGSESQHPSYSPDETDLSRRHSQRGFTPASHASTAPTSAHASSHATPSSSHESHLARQSLQGKSRGSYQAMRTNEISSSSPPRAAAHRGPAANSLSASGSGNNMTINASHHFMDLVNSNHTLSPFTRTLDTKGFAVRSHPVTPSSASVTSGNTGTGSGGYGHSAQGQNSVAPSQIDARLNRLSLDRKASYGRGGPTTYSQPNSGTTSPNRPALGRHRTFKIAKSVGHTPSPSAPSTPLGHGSDGGGSVQRWRPSMPNRANSIASTEQEQGSNSDDHGANADNRNAKAGGHSYHAAPRSSVQNSHNKPLRRPSYDQRHRHGSAPSLYNESEYSGIRTMGSIRE